MSTENPFLIYKAGAGSGKTFTLVREYLRLAMAGDERSLTDNFRHILAITFTNKAAGEMKSRILDFLEEMAAHGCDPARSPMGSVLLKSLNAMPFHQRTPLTEADLMRRAATLHSTILHNYSDLSVSTIDSFMHRVVRTFAHDLGQPVDFELSIEADEVVDQTVRTLMSLIGTEGHETLTDTVGRFAQSRMEQSKGFDVERDLKELAKQLLAEDAGQYIELLADYSLADYMDIYQRYTSDNLRFEQQVQALGVQALDLLDGAGLSESDCVQASRGIYAYFRNLSRGTPAMPNSYTVRCFESADYSAASFCKNKSMLDAAASIAQPLREAYFHLQQLMEKQYVDYNTRNMLLANFHAVSLFGELSRCFHQYLRENEILHLSEFNKIINSIVLEQDAPFVYERLGNRYRHFLIDEFQDTSRLQWQNLSPLLANGVSQGQDSLIVGDAKQSIYRFRGGDVRQFIHLPAVEGLPVVSRVLARSTTQSLDTNRRTAPAIVEFNNRFFSWVVRNRFADNDLALRAYLGPDVTVEEEREELRQKTPPRGEDQPQGYVDIHFAPPKDDEAICRHLLETVQDLVENHGYQYRDIMILARTARMLATVGSYLLRHSDVPQSSAESFYLHRSLGVNTLVAALRCLANPADRVAAATLLAHLHQLGILAHNHLECFADGDGFDLRRELMSEGIDFDPQQLLSSDLYDVCEHLLRILRLDGIDTPYIASLLNHAAAFSARHVQNISDFIEWFDEHPNLSAASSEQGNAVRLLTIHKAKGLEAPVVICPFFNQRAPHSPVWISTQGHLDYPGRNLPAGYVTFSKEKSTRFDDLRSRESQDSAMDDLNILYVALTRPRERLHLICPESSPGGTSFASLLRDFAADRTTFGDPHTRRTVPRDTSDEQSAVMLSRLSYPEWTSVVRVASPAEKALTPLLDDPVRFGTYAHELLADIQHADDVETAIQRFIRRQPLDVTEHDTCRLADFARQVVSHPSTERFFRRDYDVKNECDLTDGTSIGRPDRIVFTPDETWVVDFKTGHDLGAVHDRQVQSYCRTLTAMGYPKVSGWLLYLQPELTLRAVPAG